MRRRHSMPFGAAVLPEGGVRFRLWAPAMERVNLVLEEPSTQRVPMRERGEGWFEAQIDAAGPGTRYRFALGDMEVPDPASRFQPEDVHGASEVIDPDGFDWQDGDWRGRPWEEAVIYELHVGAFTEGGTFQALIDRLDDLKNFGVTAIELMPVADFPGRWNWGYDGAYPFAPDSAYGRPENLKTLVQEAHGRGMMVFLDVVYNHFGPEGNYLHAYAPQFFTEAHHTPWGAAINFEGADSRWVREFFIRNALYWIHEFHIDGLRLDAVHAIFDQSMPHILNDLALRVRASLPRDRQVHLILENDKNQAHFLPREDGTPNFYVAQWNDDIHHALHCSLTGDRDGYYIDYADDPVRYVMRCLTEGFAYQGETSRYRRGANRGEPSEHLPPGAFVSFIQNHDQVGNRAFGERLHRLAGPEAVKAAAAIYLIAPSPPLIFMGEEWAADEPFLFFCDFGEDLAATVREGRRKEFARFPEFQDSEAREAIPDPQSPNTFERSHPDWSAAHSAPHSDWYAFYKRLLQVRHEVVIPRLPDIGPGASGRRMGETVIVVTWPVGEREELCLYVNLSDTPFPDPPKVPGRILFTQPAGAAGMDSWPGWMVLWSLKEWSE